MQQISTCPRSCNAASTLASLWCCTESRRQTVMATSLAAICSGTLQGQEAIVGVTWSSAARACSRAVQLGVRTCGGVHHAGCAADAQGALRVARQDAAHGDEAHLLLVHLRRRRVLSVLNIAAVGFHIRLRRPHEHTRRRDEDRGAACTFVILMPRCFMRAFSRRFSSGNGTAGFATSEVSSRNTHVGENGIAYRNVGSFCRDSTEYDMSARPRRVAAK
jgi:hypothetical protein